VEVKKSQKKRKEGKSDKIERLKRKKSDNVPQAAKLLIVVGKVWVLIPGEAPYILESLVVP